MEDYHKEALNNCLITSWVAFEPSDVTNYLLENGVLSGEEVMKISRKSVTWARVQELVSSLERKSENTFEAFLSALKSCGKYDKLINELRNSAAELQRYNKKVEELIQGTPADENFMYLDMLLSVADSLDINGSLKLCEHFLIADEWIDEVKNSENPGLTTINICRKIRIVTSSNIQTLRAALNFLSLTDQVAFVEKYINALNNHELELVIKIEPDLLFDKIKETLQDRTRYFKIGWKLSHIIHSTYDRTSLVDISVERGVLILKVPTISALKGLHRDISSEKLALRLLPLFLTTDKYHCVGDTDEQNVKISVALNENTYRILKFHFEKQVPRPQDDPLDNEEGEATEGRDDPTVTSGLGPDVTVTITRTYPDSLLTKLKTTVNDKPNLMAKGRPLRNFFFQHFEDILCFKIREADNGVSFVLKVETVSALQRLEREISKGELAEDMLSTVQHTVGDKLTKNARMCVKIDENDYRKAEAYFESHTNSSKSRNFWMERSRPIRINRGSPSGPLYVDPESFEMIQQMRQERQDYVNAHSRFGSF